MKWTASNASANVLVFLAMIALWGWLPLPPSLSSVYQIELCGRPSRVATYDLLKRRPFGFFFSCLLLPPYNFTTKCFKQKAKGYRFRFPARAPSLRSTRVGPDGMEATLEATLYDLHAAVVLAQVLDQVDALGAVVEPLQPLRGARS